MGSGRCRRSGRQVEALVLTKEDKEGRLLLSKKRAQYERAWGDIEAKKEAEREVKRLSRMNPASADYTVARTYLENRILVVAAIDGIVTVFAIENVDTGTAFDQVVAVAAPAHDTQGVAAISDDVDGGVDARLVDRELEVTLGLAGHDADVVVLDRAGKDLARAGAAAVHEHDQRLLLPLTAGPAGRVVVHVLLREAALRVDDEVALVEEEFAHVGRRREHPRRRTRRARPRLPAPPRPPPPADALIITG